MAQNIGLDLGAASVVIYKKGNGIILREPSVAAVDTRGNVVAVGAKALLLYTRTPGALTLRRPIVAGNITDFNLIAEMLDRFLELAVPKARKNVAVAVRYGFGNHNREVLQSALSDCKTGKVILTDSSTAALTGSGFAPAKDSEGELDGSVVCDIGASSIEVAYIRNGEIMRTRTVLSSGDAADAAIVAYIRRRYGLAITPQSANTAKHKLSLNTEKLPNHIFLGIDGSSGMPRRISVPLSELIRPCVPQTDQAADLIQNLLSNLPHHGDNVSIANRIILVGGGAALPGIAEYISAKIGREVVAADKPTDCTAIGLGSAMP